jgi:hypothetical protein
MSNFMKILSLEFKFYTLTADKQDKANSCFSQLREDTI